MAQRRMFSLKIIDTDEFLDMPVSSRELYFQFGLRADDDGFVSNPKRILKMIGATDDDVKVLMSKKFLIPFKSGVCVISHWQIHNYIQKDRYQETRCVKEKKDIATQDNGEYKLKKGKCIQNVSKMETQVRLGEVRKGKVRLGKSKKISEQSSQENSVIEIFYKINPTISWGNKTTRSATTDMIKRFTLKGTVAMAKQVVAAQGKQYAPVATTPYQMREKIAQFKIYFDKEKNNKPKIIKA